MATLAAPKSRGSRRPDPWQQRCVVCCAGSASLGAEGTSRPATLQAPCMSNFDTVASKRDGSESWRSDPTWRKLCHGGRETRERSRLIDGAKKEENEKKLPPAKLLEISDEAQLPLAAGPCRVQTAGACTRHLSFT
jgi:hypothetical protein